MATAAAREVAAAAVPETAAEPVRDPEAAALPLRALCEPVTDATDPEAADAPESEATALEAAEAPEAALPEAPPATPPAEAAALEAEAPVLEVGVGNAWVKL